MNFNFVCLIFCDVSNFHYKTLFIKTRWSKNILKYSNMLSNQQLQLTTLQGKVYAKYFNVFILTLFTHYQQQNL